MSETLQVLMMWHATSVSLKMKTPRTALMWILKVNLSKKGGGLEKMFKRETFWIKHKRVHRGIKSYFLKGYQI